MRPVPSGSSTSTTQPCGSGASPRARRSPPRLTSTPRTPAYPGAEQLGRDGRPRRIPCRCRRGRARRRMAAAPRTRGRRARRPRSPGRRAQARSPRSPRRARRRRSRGRSPPLRARRAPSGRSDLRCRATRRRRASISAKVSADTTTGAPPASLSRHSSLVGRKRDHRASRASRAVAASSPSSAIAAASAPTASTSTSVPIARNRAGAASSPPFTAKPYAKPGARAAAHVTDHPRRSRSVGGDARRRHGPGIELLPPPRCRRARRRAHRPVGAGEGDAPPRRRREPPRRRSRRPRPTRPSRPCADSASSPRRPAPPRSWPRRPAPSAAPRTAASSSTASGRRPACTSRSSAARRRRA